MALYPPFYIDKRDGNAIANIILIRIFLLKVNENNEEICKTCKEPKTLLKPDIKSKKPAKIQAKPINSQISEKPKIMTFADIEEKKQDLGAGKITRKLEGTEIDQYKVIF